jgi:CheY-like chemotaxis protein
MNENEPRPTDGPKKNGSNLQTILMVEDDGEARTVVRAVLEAVGYEVLEARSGAQALDIWMSSPRKIHLLLTDVHMPMMPGTELAVALGEGDSGLPVVYMSGSSEEEIRKLVKLPHPMHLVSKPFRKNALEEAVRTALETRKTSSSPANGAQANLPPVGQNVLVQCERYRCLGFYGADGKWRSISTGAELPKVLKWESLTIPAGT